MKTILSVSLGIVIGFAVGYYGKCASGGCPLTRNPWVSAVLGGVFGLLIASGK